MIMSSFFLHAPATTEIYTLSLHDALPIYRPFRDARSAARCRWRCGRRQRRREPKARDRKSTRLNSSHVEISYAVFCLKKKMPVGAPLRGVVPLVVEIEERGDGRIGLEDHV